MSNWAAWLVIDSSLACTIIDTRMDMCGWDRMDCDGWVDDTGTRAGLPSTALEVGGLMAWRTKQGDDSQFLAGEKWDMPRGALQKRITSRDITTVFSCLLLLRAWFVPVLTWICPFWHAVSSPVAASDSEGGFLSTPEMKCSHTGHCSFRSDIHTWRRLSKCNAQ